MVDVTTNLELFSGSLCSALRVMMIPNEKKQHSAFYLDLPFAL